MNISFFTKIPMKSTIYFSINIKLCLYLSNPLHRLINPYISQELKFNPLILNFYDGLTSSREKVCIISYKILSYSSNI